MPKEGAQSEWLSPRKQLATNAGEECKSERPLWKSNMEGPQKTKIRTAVCSCYIIPGYIPEGI
jgi:hypothetical protein